MDIEFEPSICMSDILLETFSILYLIETDWYVVIKSKIILYTSYISTSLSETST